MSNYIGATRAENQKYRSRPYDGDGSGRNSQSRRNSNDSSKRLEMKKKLTLQSWNNSGPPMFIREQSEMSMVSEFTNDGTVHEGGEPETRMSKIKEDSNSFATLGIDEDNNDRGIQVNGGVHAGITNEICLHNKRDKNEESPPPTQTYVRQLEIDLINLKMKMALAQSQIDEHKFLAKRENSSLREYQEKIEEEKYGLQVENMKLNNELELERENAEKMILRIKEQDRLILVLNGNKVRTPKEKSRFYHRDKISTPVKA